MDLWTIAVSSLYMAESNLYVFLPGGVFLPCSHGLYFVFLTSAYVRIQSIILLFFTQRKTLFMGTKKKKKKNSRKWAKNASQAKKKDEEPYIMVNVARGTKMQLVKLIAGGVEGQNELFILIPGRVDYSFS